jgi:hypothetical protein
VAWVVVPSGQERAVMSLTYIEAELYSDCIMAFWAGWCGRMLWVWLRNKDNRDKAKKVLKEVFGYQEQG